MNARPPSCLPSARAFQLASQALPIGAFAYSGGLESALDIGLLEGEEDAAELLGSWMEASLAYLDLPSFLFMRRAFLTDDIARASSLSTRLLASRESSELQAQDRQMARALRRVLLRLAPGSFEEKWMPSTYAEALARAAVEYGLEQEVAKMVLCYGWVEQHTSALCRLIPLGPLAGQTLLDSCLRRLPTVIATADSVTEEEIGASCPGMALASALHETQYTRLFRS